MNGIFHSLLLLLLLGGCTQTAVAPPEPVTLNVAGSTEMMPVLADLTEAFTRRNPHVLFSLRGGGSMLGESWVADGQVDLAASTLLYPDDELPPGLTRVPIGLDGIAVIVHADNPITDLTLLQLRDLFSGRALDWRDVGGEPGEVLLVSREDGSGTRQLFEERVMGEEGVALTAVVMPTSRDVVEYVASQPQAIGYVSRGYVLSAPGRTPVPDAQDDVRVVRVEGRLPDEESIATQSYHLSRPIFLLRRSARREWPQHFIDFALSPAGQAIIDRYHVRVR